MDFSGSQYILEKGFYNNCADWGSQDNRICSVQPILLVSSAGKKGTNKLISQIVVYWCHDVTHIFLLFCFSGSKWRLKDQEWGDYMFLAFSVLCLYLLLAFGARAGSCALCSAYWNVASEILNSRHSRGLKTWPLDGWKWRNQSVYTGRDTSCVQL